jgi:DNA-binding transcriptional regulator YiaG
VRPVDILRIRRRAGYTQGELAEALGVSRRTVAHWETGTRRASRQSRAQLRSLREVLRLRDLTEED